MKIGSSLNMKCFQRLSKTHQALPVLLREKIGSEVRAHRPVKIYNRTNTEAQQTVPADILPLSLTENESQQGKTAVTTLVADLSQRKDNSIAGRHTILLSTREFILNMTFHDLHV